MWQDNIRTIMVDATISDNDLHDYTSFLSYTLAGNGHSLERIVNIHVLVDDTW